MLANRRLEQSLRFHGEAKAVTRGTQCNGRSDETRVPCYKNPHALSNPTRLVIRERDFVPRNAGAARKSQAFPLERELPAPPPPFGTDLCKQELDPEQPEEDPERQNSGSGDANEGYFIE